LYINFPVDSTDAVARHVSIAWTTCGYLAATFFRDTV